MTRFALLILVVSSSVMALGASPFRIEGAYALTNGRGALSGMVDFNRRLAWRLHLAEFGPDYLSLGPGLVSPGTSEMAVVWSPWRDRLSVEPYCFGGLGGRYERHRHGDTTSTRVGVALPFGFGVERLLFFWPKAPSLFFETRLLLYGDQTTVRHESSIPGTQRFLPELKLEQELRIGVRM